MKRYQINELELQYVVDVLNYLNDSEEPLSKEGHDQLNEVLVKVRSRPVLDIMIDPKVLEEAQQQMNEENNND